MKRFLTFVMVLICLSSSALAQTIKVVALEKFSTKTPSCEFKLQTLKTEEILSEFLLEKGTIISGSVIDVHKPKRGKQDGFFELQLNSYSWAGQTTDITSAKIEAVVVDYKPINPKDVGIYVAKKATNLAFKGASLGIAFVEGAATAENGERLKSGFVSAYKDSPLSYIEKGEDLNVEVGDILILKIND